MTLYNFRGRTKHPPIVELAAVLRLLGFEQVTCIPHARVSIASFQHHGIQHDINIDQPMAVHNFELICCYAEVDDRLKTLWFSIRQLAQAHGILSGSTGFLSSYALTMMPIVFLQDQCHPPILPRLQQSPLATNHRIDGYDCAFDMTTIYDTYGEDNTRTAGELLQGFGHFYGYIPDYATPGSQSTFRQDQGPEL
ncbi:hypothetical protein BGX33_005471 [Mortierella sp. NVP41]|nr:hypothetical protein BGX33_005471 [Mortierella sp. NVP41]